MQRRCVRPALRLNLGGDVSGTLTGHVLAGGADWQTIAPDGTIEIGAHYVIDIKGHGLAEVRSEGFRHGPPDVLLALGRNEQVDLSLYYFRAVMRFATCAAGLLKMNRTLYLARGRRDQGQVHLDVFEVI